MRHAVRLLLGGALALAAAVAPAAAADQALIDAAKKEGEVVWYTGMIINQVVRPLVDAFERKYPGVKVKASRSAPPDIVLKILNEARAGRPQADVFDGSTTAYPLMEAGQIEPYRPMSAGAYPADVRDADGYWTSLNLYLATPAVNTELVKDADAPRSMEDLLDPKWRGRIAWTTDLTMLGPPGFIGNALISMGEAKGADYLKRLSAQRIVNVPASQRVVLDHVIAGQYPLALMTLNNHSVISAQEGAPVRWLKIEPVVQTLNPLGLVRNGPHPNAGKLLIDFLLSPEGQNVIREANYIPAHPLIAAKDPSLKPQGGNFRVTLITPEMTARKLPEWTRIYNELFK
jgi:iron(III) transport system substrate-binding protein